MFIRNFPFVLHFAVVAPVLLLLADPAEAFTCEQSCSYQCSAPIGIFDMRSPPEPTCQINCSIWQTAACHDISSPARSAYGEAGAAAYVAAANIMQVRHSVWERIPSPEIDILRSAFPELVDQVRLRWDANPMDRWGSPPFEVRFSSVETAGQAYGFDIYIASRRDEMSLESRLELLAHELVHTRQFVDRGHSLQRFGRDYFEAYYDSGLVYDANAMEVEAERAIRAFVRELPSLIRETAAWNARVCNNTAEDVMYVATALTDHRSGGFSLVGTITSRGWWRVVRGDCLTIATGVRPHQRVFAFATSTTLDLDGLMPGIGVENLCIDNELGFEISHVDGLTPTADCSGPRRAYLPFRSIPNPWDMAFASDTYTWWLEGQETRLSICNQMQDTVNITTIRQTDDGIISQLGQRIAPASCTTLLAGRTKGLMWVYARNDSGTHEWKGDSTTPLWCVDWFADSGGRRDAEATCLNPDLMVRGIRVALAPGTTTLNFDAASQTPVPRTSFRYPGDGGGTIDRVEMQDGSIRWIERKFQTGATAEFVQTGSDDQWLYLYDRSRDLSLAIGAQNWFWKLNQSADPAQLNWNPLGGGSWAPGL